MLFMRINNRQKTGCANRAWGWQARISGLTRLLGILPFFALLHSPNQALGTTVPEGPSVTLVWNANTDPNVAGCNVYYGVASGSYTNMINVGNVTNATISGLVAGVTYYFAATAYDSAGAQSGYSAEVSHMVTTTTPSQMLIRSAPTGQLILTMIGRMGQTYDVQATQDLKTWTVIGTVTMGAANSVDFTDTNAASFLQRFYRTRETP